MMIEEKSLFGLTGRQREILKFISRYLKARGYPPSIREIGKGTGLSSSSTVHLHLAALEKKGFIRKNPSKPRAMELLWKDENEPAPRNPENKKNEGIKPRRTDKTINCPIWEENLKQEPLPGKKPYGDSGRVMVLSESIAGSPDAFIIKMTNDSMTGAGIQKGDYCIMHPAESAEDGQIALVESGGKLTIKRVFRHMNLYRLDPENRRMNPVFVKDLIFLGVFHGLIRIFSNSDR